MYIHCCKLIPLPTSVEVLSVKKKKNNKKRKLTASSLLSKISIWQNMGGGGKLEGLGGNLP